MRLPLAPDRMAKPDGAAVDVELVARDRSGRAVKTERFAAEGPVPPGGETGQHLRRKSLVQFPQPDVAQRQGVPAQDGGRAQHRAKPHDRWIERRPFAVDDHRARCQFMLGHRLLRCQDHPGGAVGDLGAVARGDFSPWPLECRLELGELRDRAVRPHAVVEIIGLAITRECRLELAGKAALLVSAVEPLLAFDRILVGIAPRDLEEMGEQFGGLAHVELDDGIGQAALEPDDRHDEPRTPAGERRQSRPQVAGTEQARVPIDRVAAKEQRGMAERVGTASENKIGLASADIAVAGVDRLHAGAAIDLHREGGHCLAHAETKCGDPRRIHLLGNAR